MCDGRNAFKVMFWLCFKIKKGNIKKERIMMLLLMTKLCVSVSLS